VESFVDSLVAVAVIVCPTETDVAGVKVKERRPSTLVVMVFSSMNFLPSFVSVVAPHGSVDEGWVELYAGPAPSLFGL